MPREGVFAKSISRAEPSEVGDELVIEETEK